MDKEIDTIKNMKENGAFKKYIEYIVFPYYKNLVPGTKINLEFPITILVGKNGSGKSSTLHALYGAPYWKSCADFWFSTEVDPIEETGGEGKNRFFYGYREDKQSENQVQMAIQKAILLLLSFFPEKMLSFDNGGKHFFFCHRSYERYAGPRWAYALRRRAPAREPDDLDWGIP